MHDKLPVNDAAFWKMRLYQAHASGRGLHTAIYDTDPNNWNEIQNVSCGIVRRHMCNTWSVIDVGCGFGALSDLVPPESKYLGIDISPDLIEIAKLRYPDKAFQVVDISNRTEFEDRQFDIAICRSVKDMIINNLDRSVWNAMLKEMRRISRYTLLMEYDTIQYEFLHNELQFTDVIKE